MGSKRLADYRVDNLQKCFEDLELSTCTINLHICYTVNTFLEPTNVLIIYVTGTDGQRLRALIQFHDLIKARRLSEDEGLHRCGDSYIVVSNSVHWGNKYREFLTFADS